MLRFHEKIRDCSAETRRTQFSTLQETETNEKPESLLFINIEKIGKTQRVKCNLLIWTKIEETT